MPDGAVLLGLLWLDLLTSMGRFPRIGCLPGHGSNDIVLPSPKDAQI